MGNPLEWVGGALLFIIVAVVNAIVNPIGVLVLAALVVWFVMKIKNKDRSRKCGCILLVASLLSLAEGCGGIAILHQMDQGSALSPEQIKAYNDMDLDVYGCFTVNGPPPSGGTTWVVVPKRGNATSVQFLPNCMVQMK